QEALLNNRPPPALQNFKAIHCVENRGQIIYVNKEISHSQAESSNNFISVNINNNIKIVNYYNPPSNTLNITEIKKLINNANNKILIAGDFNALHPLWNCVRSISSGNNLTIFSQTLLRI